LARRDGEDATGGGMKVEGEREDREEWRKGVGW